MCKNTRLLIGVQLKSTLHGTTAEPNGAISGGRHRRHREVVSDRAEVVGNDSVHRNGCSEVQLCPTAARQVLVEGLTDECVHEPESRDLVRHLRFDSRRNALIDGVEYRLDSEVRHCTEDVQPELATKYRG